MKDQRLVTAADVETFKQQNSGILLDVLTEEAFEEAHIPGAKNACVYETVFLDRVGEIVPDKATAIVVYGEAPEGFAARTAAEKLLAAGYSNVLEFRGGRMEWSDAGHSLERGTSSEGTIATGSYSVDTSESVIYWVGRNLFNSHSGTVRLSGGQLEFQESNLIGAEFEVDMNSIECSDIEDSQMNQMLVQHLKHSDFFEVDQHPTAKFVATRMEEVPGAPEGSPNFLVAGEATIRGISAPLEFDAVCAIDDEGALTAQAVFDVDRTRWGAIYGSGRFFERLGKHVVNDAVHLRLKIVARKA